MSDTPEQTADNQASAEALAKKFLADVADLGGASLLAAIALRFWRPFRRGLTSGRKVLKLGQTEIKVFAARTIVILTRPIWLVILPVMFLTGLSSSVTVLMAAGHLTGWSPTLVIGAMILKGLAFTAAVIMTVRVYRVGEIAGQPWLMVPMVVTALYSLVALTAAVTVDTMALADDVGYFHSLWSAVQSIFLLVFTLVLWIAGVLSLSTFAAMGINLGGGAWNGFVPMFRALPLITKENLPELKVPGWKIANLVEAIVIAVKANVFILAILVAEAMFYVAFHSPMALLIQLAQTILWFGAMFAWVGLTWEPKFELAKRIILVYLVGGVTIGLVRIITELVPPQPGEAVQVVMFYGRFNSLVSLGLSFFGTSSGPMIGFFIGMLVAGIVIAALGHVLHVKHADRMAGKSKEDRENDMISYLMLRTGTPMTVIALVALLFHGALAAYTSSHPAHSDSTDTSSTADSSATDAPPEDPRPPHSRGSTTLHGT